MINFEHFHFHIYFNHSELEVANEIVEKLSDREYLQIGRVWDRPIGPHPIGSCQMTVLKENFYEMSEWFLQNRKGLSIFVHAVSGDDLIDHTEYVMWIGKSFELNIDFFK